MFYQTEAKPQGWRALAILEDGTERLIYLGRSTTQVRAGYKTAYVEVLDDEESRQVRTLALQCWDGAPDRGRWVTKTTLAIPERTKEIALAGARASKALGLGRSADAAEDEDTPHPLILAFRKPADAEDDEDDDLDERPRRMAPTG